MAILSTVSAKLHLIFRFDTRSTLVAGVALQAKFFSATREIAFPKVLSIFRYVRTLKGSLD